MELIIGNEYTRKVGGFTKNPEKVILEEIVFYEGLNTNLVVVKNKETNIEFIIHKSNIY